MDKLIVSSSPHIKDKATTSRIMLDVIIALMPTAILSVYYFSYVSALIIVASVSSCVLFEYLFNLITKKKHSETDLSCVVTGLILAMNMPPLKSSIILSIIGAFIAIVVIKMLFGGIGQNIFNPAAAARIFLTTAFSSLMTVYVAPLTDGVTAATPLAIPKGELLPSYLDLFLGKTPGSLGETAAVTLIAGGIYLMIRKVITWEIPVIYIGTVALLSFAFGQDPLYSILAGGMMLGSIYMATDYTTSPVTRKGKIVYAAGLGLMTASIRKFGSNTEGVAFSLLFMNALVPLIDKFTVKKTFGRIKKK
ncbi:MAG TPA: RnfABCDGE type electron transport complex subunit D [Clostridia bacterium]|jgi:electron transport complex protein RnfD|nr:RnfABCDGE type electron transport complex subunit D [Clostridiaceae bacterium]HOF26257.1 RnfABCDGE type electron transport complex subunit D [Clostridia bacterium]HOM35035.1 RnfABCDGE type electron transport complex subunit D [Clostridia bacterium]HOR89567.1 RnfABCDGE type electron transport complex subunit D [Clostridia bacterium]HOT70027.1 RnfABCDGE type electron transport complex subunit D [Clostridia bacterium]